MARIRKGDGEATTVFSTDGGRAREPAPRAASGVVGDAFVRVSRTKAGRRGKTVTLVTGVPPGDLAEVGRELRRLVGSGGSVKDGVIEVQGDHRERLAEHLSSRYRVKMSGG